MYKVRIQVNAGSQGQTAEAFQAAEGAALEALLDGLEPVVNDIQSAMQSEGDPSESPVHWDSEKQRKAYFASDGFGAGIPYQRSGNTRGSWIKDKMQQAWLLTHPAVSARYVYGTLQGGTRPANGGQSLIHQGRWPAFSVIVSYIWNDFLATGLEQIKLKVAEAFRRALNNR